MGSVKSRIWDDSPAGQLYRPATPTSLGLAAWRVSGRFSVGDLKGLIPPVEIVGKNYALAMTASWYWERAANAGFHSTYAGMVDHNGRVVDVSTLLERGELSDIVVMELAYTPHDLTEDGVITSAVLAEYHRLISAGEITCYVADVENIFRWGVPLGSSVFEKIFRAAGMAEIYAGLATYDEVVQGLDAIRAIPGILRQEQMRSVLAKAGLFAIPNPGFMMPTAVLNRTTKFDPSGDNDLTDEAAIGQMHVDESVYAQWSGDLLRNAAHQRRICDNHDVFNVDGKTEAVVVDGQPRYADFACTADENRLMLRHQPVATGTVFLIPSNKEVQRAKFREEGVYAAIGQAKATHGDAWRDHLYEFVSEQVVVEATHQSVEMMAHAIGLVGNRLLGVDIFPAEPLESWVESFLPYASVLQA